jgi:hypothetical protein
MGHGAWGMGHGISHSSFVIRHLVKFSPDPRRECPCLYILPSPPAPLPPVLLILPD